MGADMIGYQTMIPKELTDKEKKECLHHLNELEGLLKGRDFIPNLAKEESATDPLLKELNELSPWVTDEMERISYADDDYEELEDLMNDVLEQLPEARSFLDSLTIDGRDTSSRYYTILGRLFESIFAGDMSWGDEPQGGGYETLKNLDKVGLLGKIETLTIPSMNQSVHFIKEGEDES